MFYNYDSYCAMYEDVFAWILDAFDQLKAMEDLANDLETIKIQVNSNFFLINLSYCPFPFMGAGFEPSTVPITTFFISTSRFESHLNKATKCMKLF